MFSDWVLAFKNVFLPIFCKECGRRLLTEENGFFCPVCWELSPRVLRPFCIVCGRPHSGIAGLGMASNYACARCREAGRQPYRRIYGAACYEGAIAEAIKFLKFHGKRRLAPVMGQVMAEFAQLEIDCGAYAYLVPVPLHRVRYRDRGFNQSLLLAEAILPLFANARLDQSLERVRSTRVQSRLTSFEERRANVAGAFEAKGSHLEGKTLLLIDDVVTTGGTAAECAAALKRAGAGAVDVFALAVAGHVDTGPHLGE